MGERWGSQSLAEIMYHWNSTRSLCISTCKKLGKIFLCGEIRFLAMRDTLIEVVVVLVLMLMHHSWRGTDTGRYLAVVLYGYVP